MATTLQKNKLQEYWTREGACSIRGAKQALPFVIETDTASCCIGNFGADKENTARQGGMDHDLVDSDTPESATRSSTLSWFINQSQIALNGYLQQSNFIQTSNA